ncbi:hypothetical protein [Sporosarcina limicola]|uniref:Uncharacterized protein n=1 Tax=Sporosarcina limicola TaxID=34101 RepID=A0A927MG58_9BACL|nr:hypothetical protein [Sporosarcina limicola]MBE1553161.1 hypothetical protein [Sporosarcina limicola]
MERLPIDPVEMERRQNKDFIAALKMIGEGGPIYDQPESSSQEPLGYDEEQLPRYYQ